MARAIQRHPEHPRHRVASQGGLQPRRCGEVATILVLHENWTEKVAQQGCGPIGCSLPRKRGKWVSILRGYHLMSSNIQHIYSINHLVAIMYQNSLEHRYGFSPGLISLLHEQKLEEDEKYDNEDGHDDDDDDDDH